MLGCSVNRNGLMGSYGDAPVDVPGPGTGDGGDAADHGPDLGGGDGLADRGDNDAAPEAGSDVAGRDASPDLAVAQVDAGPLADAPPDRPDAIVVPPDAGPDMP